MNAKLHVKASLHFGCQTLHKALRTRIVDPVSFSAAWDEDLEFDISIRDIPRVSQ